ncbi:MAG: ROK family protein, partial [Actinopolymorphaceae bacterium]
MSEVSGGLASPSGADGPEACVVALDVGGTTMKGALVDFQRAVRYRHSFPTPVEAGPEAVVDQIGTA